MSEQPTPRTYKAVCIDAAGSPTSGPLIQFAVARSLKPLGLNFEVMWTVDGQEGLDLIARIRPDLIFLDFAVLGIDGFEVYQRMKTDDYMRTIPIVVITARRDLIDQFIGVRMTVEACFAKPFTHKEFVPVVMEILGLTDQEGS